MRTGGSFKFRVFRNIILLVLVGSCLSGVFYAHRQKELLEKELVEYGASISKIFATNLRLGLMTGSDDFLSEPLAGILEQKHVLQASVFGKDGALVKVAGDEGLTALGEPSEVMARLADIESPVHLEGKRHSEFWMPVYHFKSRVSHEEDFFPTPTGEKVLLGYARVTLSRDRIIKETRAVILSTIVVTFLFILAGSLIAYLMARRVTRPIRSLSDAISAMEKEGIGPISVSGDDEIMRLAGAFNRMAESLKKRELEKKKSDEEKRKLEQIYHQSQKLEALGRLAGGISHDFNNILTIIFNSLALARMHTSDIVTHHVERAVDAARRGKTMVENLLSFSHGTAAESVPVDFGKVVNNTVQLVYITGNRDVKVDIEVVPGLWQLRGNPSQLQQIVMNLYQNARDAIEALPENEKNGRKCFVKLKADNVALPVKYMAENPLAKAGEFVRLTVMDNGCGMDDSALSKIFEPFFSTKDDHHSGIGLSSVHGIVKQYGGWIDVESTLGSGTTFSVYLPRFDGEAVTEAVQSPCIEDELTGGDEIILVVDDEAHLVESVKEMLGCLGYAVMTAHSGEETLKIFRKKTKSIDLVIMDMVMPGLSGPELFNEIRKISPEIPVIITSASARYYQGGFIDIKNVNFLPKPYDYKDLASRVREMLGEENNYRIKRNLAKLKVYSVNQETAPYNEEVTTAETIYNLFSNLSNEPREKFIAVYLDVRNRIIAYEDIAQGTLDKVAVYPQEVIRTALLAKAASVILVHNHPSGSAEPSDQDIILTAQIMQAGKLLNIGLLDHIIIGEDSYLSFKEEKLL